MMRETEDKRRAGHTVHMEDREKAMITGVQELGSFNEEEVLLVTDEGLLTIEGEGLHIDRLNLEDGQLIVKGFIYGFSYEEDEEPASGILSRLFRR